MEPEFIRFLGVSIAFAGALSGGYTTLAAGLGATWFTFLIVTMLMR